MFCELCAAPTPREGDWAALVRGACARKAGPLPRGPDARSLPRQRIVFARCGKQVAKNFRRGAAQTPTPAGPGDCFIGRLFIKAEVRADKGYREENKK